MADQGGVAPAKRCRGCEEVLPIEAFAWKDRARGRRQPRCPPCHRVWRRASYRRLPDAQRLSVERSRARRRDRNRDLIRRAKAVACADCCERFGVEEMDFDHVRGRKEANIADVVSDWSVARLQAEIAKCDVVCANCHRLRTARRQRGQQDL